MDIRRNYQRTLLLLAALPAFVGCALLKTAPLAPLPGGGPHQGAHQQGPKGPEQLGPQMVVGQDGALALFWVGIEWRKSWAILFSRSEDRGKTWLTPPLSLKPDKGTVAGKMEIATDSKARLYVAWREWDVATKQRRILLLRSQDGGRSWDPSPKELVSSPDLGFPHLLAEADGMVYVAWLDGPASSRHLKIAVSRDAGQTFEEKPTLLSAASPRSKGGMANIRMASDGTGRIYVAWEEGRTPREARIYLNRSLDHGRSWAAEPILLGPSEGGQSGAYSPSIHVAEGGRVAVAWYQFERRRVAAEEGSSGRGTQNDRVVYLNRSVDAGQTWLSQQVRLNVIDGAVKGKVESLSPQLSSDRNGNLYAVWVETDGPDPKRLLFARSPDFGSSWSTPHVQLELTSPFRTEVFDPLLRADHAGHVWVLWQERTLNPDGAHLLMNGSEDRGQTWRKQAIVMTPPSQHVETIRDVAFTNDETGRLYLAWDGGRGSGLGITLSRSLDFGRSWLPDTVRIDQPQ